MQWLIKLLALVRCDITAVATRGTQAVSGAHLHGTDVEATQEELERHDQAEHGAVHVGRRARVPGEHGQEVWALCRGFVASLTISPVAPAQQGTRCLAMTAHVKCTGIAAGNSDMPSEIERKVASWEGGKAHMRPLSYSPRPLKSSRRDATCGVGSGGGGGRPTPVSSSSTSDEMLCRKFAACQPACKKRGSASIMKCAAKVLLCYKQ